jgi:hypothetical protein
MRVEDEVRRQLDNVVGDRYDPPRDARNLVLKWLAAAVLAVAAAATVMTILHTHLMQAQTAPPPPSKKPVPVRIVPAN